MCIRISSLSSVAVSMIRWIHQCEPWTHPSSLPFCLMLQSLSQTRLHRVREEHFHLMVGLMASRNSNQVPCWGGLAAAIEACDFGGTFLFAVAEPVLGQIRGRWLRRRVDPRLLPCHNICCHWQALWSSEQALCMGSCPAGAVAHGFLTKAGVEHLVRGLHLHYSGELHALAPPSCRYQWFVNGSFLPGSS